MATLNINNVGIPTNINTQNVTSSQIDNKTVIGVQNDVSYTPIGFGKPLSAEILTVYTGSFIKKGLFAGDKRDILCVTGAKASETFDATPRALNLLQHQVENNTYLEFSAFSAATPYIYYKNAVDTNTLEITIELAANSFNEGIFDTVAGLMSKAAGMPIFMPVAGKLLAGSQLITSLESGANNLFSSAPFLSETITIRFDTAGMPINTAQCMLICRDEDETELSAYQVNPVMVGDNPQMRLVKSGVVYGGEAPYAIINIDGANKPDLQAWTTTLASSSVLSEFYGSGDKVSGVGETLQQAMSLYNDYTYYTKANAVAQQLKSVQPDTAEYTTLETQYKAFANNIQNTDYTTLLSKN